MIVSQFQSWAETAPAPSRADGVSALARAFLYSDLDAGQRRDAVRALTGFLDDPSPLVRRALASAFASATEAPPAIVQALADDHPAIAAIVLSRSPILSDAALLERIEGGDEAAQAAIALRPHLAPTVVDCLAARGAPGALAVLAANIEVVLPDPTIRCMVRRHGDHGRLREALLARGQLPLDIRAQLVAATASALAAFVTQRAWMPEERTRRITRDATERATIAIAATDTVGAADLRALVGQLRDSGQLTVALAFRTLLSGNRALFEAMLCDLSGVAASRVEGLTRHYQAAGFAALYRKAGFPEPLLPAFRMALSALRDGDLAEEATGPTALSAGLVAKVLAACLAANDGAFDKLLVLLRRFDAEAVRESVRAEKRQRRDGPVAAPGARPVTAPLDRTLRTGQAGTIHFDEAVPVTRALSSPAPSFAASGSGRVTIDLAAIEAELIAA